MSSRFLCADLNNIFYAHGGVQNPCYRSIVSNTETFETRLLTLVELNVGGKDFGISPGEGEISFTLRADEEKDLAELEQWLRRTVTEADPFPATVNHKECAEKVFRAARGLGLQLVPMAKPWRLSEDFG